MPKPLKKLRIAMMANDMTQVDIANLICKTKTYVTWRMTGRASFSTTEAYQIIRALKLDIAEFFEYFPPIKEEIQCKIH